MEPLSVAASIISVVGGISATSKTIKAIKGLPKAFVEVQNDLPLVLSILRGAQNSLLDGQEITEDEKKAVLAILQPCHGKAEELKRIFDEVRVECEKDKDAKDWAKLRAVYHKALQGVKALSVEHLMMDILEGMKKLALSQVFNSATQNDVQALEKAIGDLWKIEPSLPDSEFGTDGQIHASQHNASRAIAQRSNVQGGFNTFDSGKYVATGTGHTFNYEEINRIAYDPSKACLRSLGFLEIDNREHDICAAVDNTCDWLFRTTEFEKWRTCADLSTHNRVLCIKGKPGVGKSTLMKHTLAHCRKIFADHLIVAYFFNARGVALEKTPLGMLRSILYQFIKQDSVLFEEFLTKFREKQNLSRDSGWEWRLQELRAFMASVIGRGKLSRSILIIDALDECNEVEAVMDFLKSLSSNAIRICVSRRHYPPLSLGGLELTVENNEDHMRDIVIYVQAKLAKRDDRIESQIKSKAGGMFMWVVLVVSLLNKAYLEGDNSKRRDILQQVPEELEEVFQILLIKDNDIAKTVLLLQLVLFSQRPLGLAELFFAVEAGAAPMSLDQWSRLNATNDDIMQKWINYLSRGLVEVRSGGEMTVQFIHLSVSGFLLRNKRLQKLDPSLEPEPVRASHYRMWVLCRSCIDLCRSHINRDSSIRTKKECDELRHRYPFLNYAAEYVFDHAEKVLDEGPFAREDHNEQIGKWLQEENGWFEWLRPFVVSSHRVRSLYLGDVMDAGLLDLLSSLGYRYLVKSVLEGKGAEVNAQGGEYGNALQTASYNGYQKIVELLLEKGAEVNAQGGYFSNALQAASWIGDQKTVELLLEKGAEVNAQGGRFGNALQAASLRGDLKIVELLLEKGAEVNAQGGEYNNALQAASFRGDQKIVELLLEKGAEVNAQGGRFGNALQAASYRGDQKIVELLLEKGAEVNAQGGEYRNALQAASFRGDQKIVELLLEKGAEVNAQGGKYGNALYAASTEGHERIVRILLEYGANVNATGVADRSAIRTASASGHQQIVQILIRAGANNVELRPFEDLSPKKSYEKKVSFIDPIVGLGRSTLVPSEYNSSSSEDVDDDVFSHNPESSHPTTTTDPSIGIGNTVKPTVENIDAKTSYSEDHVSTATYIKELASAIFQNLESDLVDASSLDPILAVFEQVVGAFALKFGHENLSDEAQEDKVRISQHRKHIKQSLEIIWQHHLQQKIEEMEEGEDEKPHGLEGMSLDDKMNMWIVEGDIDTLEDMNSSSQDEPGLADMSLALPEWSDSGIQSLHLEEQRVTESWAFRWLIMRLKRELYLQTSTPDRMLAIRRKILKHIPRATTLSRAEPVETFGAEFNVDWDPLTFVTEQQYEARPSEALAGAITLTGSAENAQALTCAEYVDQTWPSSGRYTLQLLQKMLDSERSDRSTHKTPDGTELIAWMQDRKVHVRVQGVAESIAEVAEHLEWFGSALRSSTIPKGVAYCTPQTSIIRSTKSSSGLTEIFLNTSFHIVPGATNSDIPQGMCWQSMFHNPVVVKGYPILRRVDCGIGLEVPLHIMAGRTRAQRITKFDGKIYVKSFSTMLLATEHIKDDNLVKWHFLYHEDGSHISYLDQQVKKLQTVDAQDLSFDELESTRHVIGWCSPIKNFAGAQDAPYCIQPSRQKEPQAGVNIDRITITAGKLVTCSVSGIYGIRDKPAYFQWDDSYLEKILYVSSKYFILYDEDDKKAWLVNGASALLHLVRASLENLRQSRIGHKLLFKSTNLKEAEVQYTAHSAFNVLIDDDNMELEILPHKNEISAEKGDDAVEARKKNTRHVLFQDVVERVHHFLEQLLTYQAEKVAAKTGVDVKIKPRNFLGGFDFMEVARGERAIPLRITNIQRSGKCWIDFARAIHAVTLFGRGFGDILRPEENREICQMWSTMPKGEDYLAVCVSDLTTIIQEYGDLKAEPLQVANNIHWHSPDKIFEACKCTRKSRQNICDRAQVLLPSGFNIRHLTRRAVCPSSWEDKNQGAIIFGRSHSLPLHWPDRSDEDPEIKDEISDSVGPDDQKTTIGPAIATITSAPERSVATADSNSRQRSELGRLSSPPLSSNQDGSSTITIPDPRGPTSGSSSPLPGTLKKWYEKARGLHVFRRKRSEQIVSKAPRQT